MTQKRRGKQSKTRDDVSEAKKPKDAEKVSDEAQKSADEIDELIDEYRGEETAEEVVRGYVQKGGQ